MGKQQAITTLATQQPPKVDFDTFLRNKGIPEDKINSMSRAYANVTQEQMPGTNLAVSGEQYVEPAYEFQQSFLTDLAESFYNGLVDTAEGLASLPATIAIGAGAESSFWDNWMDGVNNWATDRKYIVSDAANKPLSDDWTNMSAWANGIGQGLGFITSMATGGGIAAKGASLLGKTGKSVNASRRIGGFITGTAAMSPAIYEQAIDSGISKSNAARLALSISGIVSLTEGAALEWMGKSIAKPVSTKVAKESFNEALVQLGKKGVLTEGDFNDVVKLTGIGFGKKMKAMGAKAIEPAAIEFGQEFSQTYIEEGIKELYDKTIASDKKAGEGAFGADTLSWNTFNDALAGGFVGGLIGGGLSMKGSLFNGLKGETVFSYVDNAVKTNSPNKITELGTKVKALQSKGQLADNPEKLQEHIDKIVEFSQRTKPLNVTSTPAKYQLFQMMEVEKQMTEKIQKKYQIGDDTHKIIADAYSKNIKAAGMISGALNEDMKLIVEEKEPLQKNKDKFENTLGKYIGLYQEVLKGDVSEKELAEVLPTVSYAAKKQVQEQKKAEKLEAEKVELEKQKGAESTKVEIKSEQEAKTTGEKIAKSAEIKIDPISEEEFNKFKEDKTVSDERLTDIVQKVVAGDKLSDEERVISMDDSVTQRKLDIIKNNNFGQDKYEADNKKGIDTLDKEVAFKKWSEGKPEGSVTIENFDEVLDAEMNILKALPKTKVTDSMLEEHINNSKALQSFGKENALKAIKEELGKTVTNKKKQDAIQKSETEGVDVRQQAGNGQGVGSGNTKEQKTAKQSEKEEKQKELAKERDKRNAIKTVDSLTFEDAVLKFFLNGGRISAEHFKRNTGYKGQDLRKYIWAIAHPSKGGVQTDLLNEVFDEYDNYGFEDQQMAERAFYDILTQHTGKKSIFDRLEEIYNSRNATIEEAIDPELLKQSQEQQQLENENLVDDLLNDVKIPNALISFLETHGDENTATLEDIEALVRENKENLFTGQSVYTQEEYLEILNFIEYAKQRIDREFVTSEIKRQVEKNPFKYIEDTSEFEANPAGKTTEFDGAETEQEGTGEGINYQSKDSIDSGTLKANNTKQLLKNKPQVAKQIIDRLKSLFPKIRFHEGGLFDSNGNWIALPGDKAGMAYRDAVQSAVAWANDSYLETPPHEYAHIYIDMFRNHPLVKSAIEKYGEENLATMMGRHFAGREMSSKISKWISDFWNMVRNLFGHPSIGEEISRAFYEGKNLSPTLAEPSGEVNYQDKPRAESRLTGTFDTDDQGLTEDPAQMVTEQRAIEGILERLGFEKVGKVNPSWLQKDLVIMLKNLITVVDTSSRTPEYRNKAGLDQRDLNEAIETFLSDKAARNIAKYMSGDANIQLDAREQKAFDVAIKSYQRMQYRRTLDQSVFASDGKLAPLSEVTAKVKEEISKASENRKRLYAKYAKNPKMKKVLEFAERYLLRMTTSSRLGVKYLSGSEKSLLSKFFYDSLDHADTLFKNMTSKFETMIAVDKNDFKKWSHHNTPNQNIDYYEGKEFDIETVETDDEGKETTSKKKVKLTKEEMLTLYLTLRQTEEPEGGSSPYNSVTKYGFNVKDIINGRDLNPKEILRFPRTGQEVGDNIASKQQLEFMAEMENDPKVQELVSKIDPALDYMHNETSKTFKLDQGYALPKIGNYFPVYSGKPSQEVIQQKNAIEDFRAGYERKGYNGPLQIRDANEVINSYKNNGSLYASHALPVSNNRKLLAQIRNEYAPKSPEASYVDKMTSVLNTLEDSTVIVAGQGEKDVNSFINRITNNFSLAVLGMNIGTMLKQPVGYLATKTMIDPKYLKKAGWGIGGITGIKPGQIWRSLAYTGIKGGETMLPVEWKQDTSNETYQEIVKNSPKLKHRIEGAVSREAGEAMVDAQRGKDKINLGFKDRNGDPMYVSKSRLLEGMKIFDNATIMAVWNAVKMETQDMYPGLEGQEFLDRVAIRTESIIAKTQGDYGTLNATELSLSKNPLARVITMFGTQSSTLGMLLIDGTIDFMNNPTAANRKKMLKRYVDIMVLSSLALATIDVLKQAVLHGFDDDDEMPKMLLTSTTVNAFGNVYGLSQLSRLLVSRMDNQPWTESLQHPAEAIGTQFIQGLYDLMRGYKLDKDGKYQELTIDNGLFEIGKSLFMAKGLPIAPFTQSTALYNRVTGD